MPDEIEVRMFSEAESALLRKYQGKGKCVDEVQGLLCYRYSGYHPVKCKKQSKISKCGVMEFIKNRKLRGRGN